MSFWGKLFGSRHQKGIAQRHSCPGCGQLIHAGMITLWPDGKVPDGYQCSRCDAAIDHIVRTIVQESDQKTTREMKARGQKHIDQIAAKIESQFSSLRDFKFKD